MKSMKKAGGWGLIETAIVIAIVAVLAGVVFLQARNTNESVDADVFERDYLMLTTMVQKSRGPSSFDAAGLTVDEIIAADKSEKLTVSDGAGGELLRLAGKFPVTDISAATSLSTNDSFASTVDGFTDQQCSDIVRRVWGVVNSVDVNGVTVKANRASDLDAASATAIATNCSELENSGAANVLILTKNITG